MNRLPAEDTLELRELVMDMAVVYATRHLYSSHVAKERTENCWLALERWINRH